MKYSTLTLHCQLSHWGYFVNPQSGQELSSHRSQHERPCSEWGILEICFQRWPWATQALSSSMICKTLLSGYDLNSDGRVTVKEFRRIMGRTGNRGRHHCKLVRTLVGFLSGKMSDGDIEKMIEKADVDNDGWVKDQLDLRIVLIKSYLKVHQLQGV